MYDGVSMIVWLVALAIISLATGCGAGLIGLGAALYFFLESAAPQFSSLQYAAWLAFLAAAPAAAWLSAFVVERFCFQRLQVRALRQAAVLLCLVYMFGEAGILDYWLAAHGTVAALDWLKYSALLLAVINGTVLCAGIVSFGLIGAVLLLEVPVCWLTRASGTRLWVPFGAVRPLAAVIFACLAFNLIVGLFVAELAPTSILRKIL